MTKQEILDNLKEGDYIAFGFNYNGGDATEIQVSNITLINSNNEVLVHFLYGHNSLAEYIHKDKILAFGDNEKGTINIKGWTGKYIPFNQDEINRIEKGK